MVLGDGIEAMSACLEGRSGVGSGTVWGRGVISARALVAQEAQMRVVESKRPLEERDTELEAEVTANGFIVGHGDTGDGGISGPPTAGSR